MTYHRDMCSKADCSTCDPNQPAKRTAKFAEKLFNQQCFTEAREICQKRWAEHAPTLQCKLCKATVKNPRISPDNNRRRATKNKWYTKKLESDGDKENWEPTKAIHICAMCMSGKWDILEPNNWTSALIRTENLSTQASRVWRNKLDGEINAYHKEADGYLRMAEDHYEATQCTPERNRKRSLDLMETTQRNALRDFIAKKQTFQD
jgi:hypothetical protein